MTTSPAVSRRPSPWDRDYRTRLLLTDILVILISVFGTQLISFGTEFGYDVGFNRPIDIAVNYTWISVVLSISWLLALQIYDSRDRRIVGSGYAEYRRIVDASIRLFGVVAIIAYLFQIFLARGYI
ncbi:hypothetical protein, partial [Escherichia coli]|uniref:hypothetical protein n=1 Tax=Escherichia coli TaxID=562 RepID=UPI001329FCB1